MADNELWRPVKSPPYKYGVAAYGGNITDIIGVAAYGGWHRICHAIMPLWRHGGNLTTLRRRLIIIEFTNWQAS